jgi:transmembrane sensor
MNQGRGTFDLPKLKLGWDERRTERLLARVHSRLNRRKRARRAALTTGALATVLAVLVSLRWSPLRSNVASVVDPASEVASHRSIKLLEGSVIDLDPAKSEVRIVEESATRVSVELVRGSGRYSVVPNPGRTFEVRSGSVTVTVVGTEFTVEQRTEGTWVETFRGKVRVAWDANEAFVSAGESGIFPPSRSAAANPAEALPHEEWEAPAARSPQATQAYRSRVARHDYRGAYAVLSRNPALAGDTVEELLVAADVARLSDHPAEALPYLQRVVREHPRDERAPLAAFTLGRTLLGLGRAQEAMSMFGRVRSSWPQSPLAEDALLRQAEAASQMGDLATARRIAEQYDRDYPNGRRRAEARRYARLE